MTPQNPLPSGFNAASTTNDVLRGIDLSGKTAIVTGGYAGLGRETVRAFLAAGARVIVPARDVPRARAALAALPTAEVEPMDLLAPATIDAFAARFVQNGQPLHLLVNSAGIMAGPLVRDARGFEAQFATNHLGHFQLTAKLWPALLRAHGARVVAVSSAGHRFSPVVFNDPNFERRPYDQWQAYGQSKTANVLFAVKLDDDAQSHGVRAFAVHPGGIVTGLAKHVSLEELRKNGVVDEHGVQIIDPSRGLKNIEQGAATQVWSATHPALAGHGGVYCENVDIAVINSASTAVSHTRNAGSSGVLPYAVDRMAAADLWRLSERLLGFTFTP